MKNLICFFVLFGAFTSSVVSAQTNYSGVSFYSQSAFDSISLTRQAPNSVVDLRENGALDSIMLTIWDNTRSQRLSPFPISIKAKLAPNLQFQNKDIQLTVIKDDPDSIIFMFKIGIALNVFREGQGSKDTVVNMVGIAWISKTTAGVQSTFQAMDNNRIYPNPVYNILNIQAAMGGILSIYDQSGKLVMTQKTSIINGVASVDVSSLPTGSYLLVSNNGDHQLSGRFIKY